MTIVIGSGAGGAIIAMKLAKNNFPVTIIEKGPYVSSKNAFDYYDKHIEGIDLLKTTCIGGSTLVSAGNGVRSLEKNFKEIGIDLSNEYDEVEKLLNIHQMDDKHIGEGTQKFIDIAKEFGFEAMKMPKFIRDEECTICGKCSFGCPKDAKWSSKDFIDIAVKNGAKLLTNTEANKLIFENNKIKGVEIIKNNETKIIESDQIILAAGAINSAIILQKSGINAGEKLFFDPFVTVGGLLKDIGYNQEVQMNALAIGDNYILAPHFSTFAANYLKENGYDIENKDILSIMVKVPDDGLGKVEENGNVIKYNTINDVKRLAEGSAAAGAILAKAGVDPTTITSTVFRGAHPGGTAAIGEVVDKNLQTEIEGLYVGDASVIPWAPGKPPILLILALALRLANHLIEN